MTTEFTWFTPTLGLRPPKIVKNKPSGFFLFLLVFQQGYNISSSNTAAFQRKAHIDNNTKKPYCKAFNFKGKRKTLQQIKKSYYSHSVLFFQIYLRSTK